MFAEAKVDFVLCDEVVDLAEGICELILSCEVGDGEVRGLVFVREVSCYADAPTVLTKPHDGDVFDVGGTSVHGGW